FEDTPVETEGGVLTVMLGVKMRRCVIVKVHANDDAKECGNDRHVRIVHDAPSHLLPQVLNGLFIFGSGQEAFQCRRRIAPQASMSKHPQCSSRTSSDRITLIWRAASSSSFSLRWASRRQRSPAKPRINWRISSSEKPALFATWMKKICSTAESSKMRRPPE